MNRTRSPGYPSLSLPQAIELIEKVHKANRTNIITRETSAKDMGYTGLTGRSLTVLAALSQYGLIEKAGKGDIKVSRRAVDILHSIDPNDRAEAIQEAAAAPALFQALRERFPDGVPSQNALRSYLIQMEYADVAIGPAITAFLDTIDFAEKAKVSERTGRTADDGTESGHEGVAATAAPVPSPPVAQPGGYRVMDGERVVFSEEVGASSYLKLVASGEMNVDLLDALADFITRQKRRLGFLSAASATDQS